MLLRKTFRFEASHMLPKHPGKCSRLHGHSWVLHVFVEGSVDPVSGFVMDYADISKKVKPLIDILDHHHLGQWEKEVRLVMWHLSLPSEEMVLPRYFYPSSENLLWWIGYQLKNEGLNWSKLALEETCTSYAELTKEEFAKTSENEECGRAEGKVKEVASNAK